MGKPTTIPKRPLDGAPTTETLLRNPVCFHKIVFCQKITLLHTIYQYYLPPQRWRFQNGLLRRYAIWLDNHRLQRISQVLHSTRIPTSMWIWRQERSRNHRNQQGRSGRQERNDSKHCCNVTTCLSNRSVTGKHCAPMLIWMNARGLTSNVIPMNVPIFIGKNATTAAISKANNSPRQLLSVNLPTHPHMNPAISAKILSKTLSLFGFFYTQNYVFQSLPLCSMY